jgi:hypothetical protein
MAEKSERGKPEIVNPLQGLPWKGPKRTLDPDQDAWAFSAPPLPGLYKVTLAEQKAEFIKYDKDNEATWCYRTNIEGRIEDEGDSKGIPAFMMVSSYIGRGKENSTMLAAVVKLGYGDKLPKEGGKIVVSDDVLTKFLSKILAKNPSTTWELDWRCGYKYTETKTGKEKFKNVCSTYDDFPDDPEHEGQKLHKFVVTDATGGKQEVSAQLNVVNWVGKGEKPKVKAAAAEVDLGEDLEVGETAVKASPEKKESKKKEAEDELDLD